jgi:hypothetical protein
MKQYLTSPPYIAERLKNTDWQDIVKDKWTFSPDSPHLHNNLATNCLRFDTEQQCFVLNDVRDSSHRNTESLGSVISSSLLLYRLICVFNETPIVSNAQEAYKSVWEFPLCHRSTSDYFTFIDYKGAATVNSYHSRKEDMSEQVASDFLELITFLTSDQVAHPYDHLLAGSVA